MPGGLITNQMCQTLIRHKRFRGINGGIKRIHEHLPVMQISTELENSCMIKIEPMISFSISPNCNSTSTWPHRWKVIAKNSESLPVNGTTMKKHISYKNLKKLRLLPRFPVHVINIIKNCVIKIDTKDYGTRECNRNAWKRFMQIRRFPLGKNDEQALRKIEGRS